jgi:hypothetical protein
LEVPIRFQPTSLGMKSANITITSDAPTSPTVVAVTGNVPPGDIRVTGSTTFGEVCAGTVAERTVSVCNVGPCNLAITGASINCPDFTLINNPFPAAVSPDSCLGLTIRYTPISAGPHTCTLTITSNDPDTPVVNLTLTAATPLAAIDVPFPAGQGFPPEVIQSVGACQTLQPFPISNTGTCPLRVTDVAIGGMDPGDFALSGLPSFPVILEPGHIVGEGDLNTAFRPTVVDRDRLANVMVTYVSEPVTGTTTTVTRALCGEGVRTGARVLVTHNGVPVPTVEHLQLHRIQGGPGGQERLQTVDSAKDLALETVTPAAPCPAFQYHREWGTTSNPVQLLPGSYRVTARVRIEGRNERLTVAFDVTTCDFNPTVVVDF